VQDNPPATGNDAPTAANDAPTTANGDALPGSVAIVGSGSIGAAFALLFALAGNRVRLHDPDPQALGNALPRIARHFADLRAHGLADASPETVLTRIAPTESLAETVSYADHVQECAPEDLDLKRALFAELEALAPPSAVLASSSSALPASRFAADLASRHRCLVAHPGNPPTLLRVIEIVPAPFTDPAVAERCAATFRMAGLSPIVLGREVEGFVFNRLQGAVLREAYCLVRDGVASVEDIDAIMRDGLGLRWAVIGPFETADLNTRGGIAVHAARMGPAYARMGAERGQDDPWTPDLVGRVAAARRTALPLGEWGERVAWRDRELMRLLAARQRRGA